MNDISDFVYGDRTLRYLLQPIAAYLCHPEVTDIVINKPFQVGFRMAGQWQWIDVPSFDFATLDAMSILIGQRTGKEFDEGHPYTNSTLPGGQRFQGVRPPGTKAGRILWAIRRPPTKARSIDDADFDDAGLFETTNRGLTLTQSSKAELGSLYKARRWRDLFRAGRMAGLSMAMCGQTGGGKSDFARRMIGVGRPGVRMVTLETDDEFGEAGPDNKAAVFYDEARITSDEAVRISLRLVPVEIFLGEVRGQEAYSLLRALESGHNGCTSLHAKEGRALEALEIMVRMHPAGREMPSEQLIEMMNSALDIIVYNERESNGKFRVTRVTLSPELEAL